MARHSETDMKAPGPAWQRIATAPRDESGERSERLTVTFSRRREPEPKPAFQEGAAFVKADMDRWVGNGGLDDFVQRHRKGE